MALKALIFDVDGTLAETEEAHRAAFNRTFAEFGFDVEWGVDEYHQLLQVGGGKERRGRDLAQHLLGQVAVEDIIPDENAMIGHALGIQYLDAPEIGRIEGIEIEQEPDLIVGQE